MIPDVEGEASAERARLLAENAVISVLAVGGYSLEKVYARLSALQEGQLTDSVAVGTLGEKEVFLRLLAAGYDRGPVVTNMMAKRLISAHQALRDGLLQEVADLIDKGRCKEAEALAVRVPGIGPRVFEQFMLLHKS